MRFRILGPLEILDGDGWRGIGAPKWRILWALLLINAGQVLPPDRIIAELWGDAPPRTAGNLVHGYVARLRALLDDRHGQLLTTRMPGYRLVVETGDIDAERFGALVDAGRHSLRTGQVRQASAQLNEALALWRGRALADVPETPLMRDEAARLEERRLSALEARIGADLANGMHAALVPELIALTNSYSLREHLWANLMLALYRCGRQAEALATYRQVKRRLADELGIDPGAELQRLELAILRNDANLAISAFPERPSHVGDDPPAVEPNIVRQEPDTADGQGRREQPATPPPRQSSPVPAQLPPDLSTFTGRTTELERLLALHTLGKPASAVVGVIDGLAGVGKSALAIHAAHLLANHYPDGQLYIDLHGHTQATSPVDPAQALVHILRSLNIPGEQIPDRIESLTALYRTHLANRRMLILLDNAHSDTQVRPLLPAAPRCLVLITSRRRLTGLDDVHPLSLDVLPHSAATSLFTQVAGPDRLAGECPELIAEAVTLGGGLPLAIRSVAVRLRSRPSWTLADLTERLANQSSRLTGLTLGDRSVATAFSASYQGLDPEQRSFFRVLGRHPGRDIEPHAAAALAGTTVATADRLLEELTDTSLLKQHASGRYELHDLLRTHTSTPVDGDPDADGQRAALDRLLDHYTRTAAIATRLAYPYATDLPAPPEPLASTVALNSRRQAVAWLDGEHANLLAAAVHGGPGHLGVLSATLGHHLRIRARHAYAHTLHTQARTAAKDSGDRDGELSALLSLGETHHLRNQYAQATRCFTAALPIAVDIGSRVGELNALLGLGEVRRREGDYEPAHSHYRQALDIARDTGHRNGELNALWGLADLHRLRGRYELATLHHNKVLAIARHLGNDHGVCLALWGIGRVHRQQSGYDAAVDRYLEALAIARDAGHRNDELNLLWSIGDVRCAMDQPDRAGDIFGHTLTIAREIGSRDGEFESLHGLGRVCHATGKPNDALNHYFHAYVVAREIGQRHEEARAHESMAEVHLELGNHMLAAHHRRRAAALLGHLSTTTDVVPVGAMFAS